MIRIARILSALAGITRIFSLALLLPIPIAMVYDQGPAASLFGAVEVPAMAVVFAAAFLVTLVFWVPVRIATRRIRDEDLLDREAYLTVALGWLLVSAFAMLPFVLWGMGALDSYFEAMSGLTGTGMSAVHTGHVGDLPASLIWWRAFTQWLGGLGIIVLTVALLSKLTHGGLQLFRSEAGAHAATRIQPKLAEVARGLWRMYGVITIVFAAALTAVLRFHLHLRTPQALFDGMVGTFAAYGTSGFAGPDFPLFIRDPWVEALLGLMMVAGATNFTLTFLLVRRGQVRPILSNPEWRFWITWVACAVPMLALILHQAGSGPWGLVGRQAGFTAVSLATGTGLSSADYTTWPHAAILILMMLILVGGTAGSAAGGLKAFRALVLGRVVVREMRRILHPRAVVPVRVGGRVVPESSVTAVIAFLFAHLALWVIGAFLLAVFQPSLDLSTAASTSLAALGNVGATFGGLSDSGAAGLVPAGKLVCTALMWFGRMEIFAALLVLTPRAWRN